MKTIANGTPQRLRNMGNQPSSAYVMLTKKKAKKVGGLGSKGVYDIGMILASGIYRCWSNDIGPVIKLPDKPIQ